MVSIRDILRNRAYLGTYSRFGVRVPGSHPSLVSTDDFRIVQDRLNARRTSYAPRVASQFLLSGIAHCGYCGNKLIGVSRKQSWKRQSGEKVSNSYRYYQCESRTNQSVCSYHTRRADDLEAQVRQALGDGVRQRRGLPAGRRRRGRARRAARRARPASRAPPRHRSPHRGLHRRGGRRAGSPRRRCTSSASPPRASAWPSRTRIEAVERRIADHLSASDRKRGRERDVTHLLDAWDEVTFAGAAVSASRSSRARHRLRRPGAQPHPPRLRSPPTTAVNYTSPVAPKSITITSDAARVLAQLDEYAAGSASTLERLPLQNGARIKLATPDGRIGLNLYPSKGGGCKIVFDQPASPHADAIAGAGRREAIDHQGRQERGQRRSSRWLPTRAAGSAATRAARAITSGRSSWRRWR